MVRKSLLFLSLLFFSLFLSGCALKKMPAALQINSTPTANVFVDGKLLGKTPFNSDTLEPGEVTIKLIPESVTEALPSWESKIRLNSGILTLIEREFTASESNSSGYTLTLERTKDKNTALISVVTEPDGALIKIDGETKGVSPLTLDKVDPRDHEVVLSKENSREKILRVKNVLGYRLLINAELGQDGFSSITPTPTAAAVSPVPTKAVGASAKKSFILVKENSLGFLRVRSTPKGTEIAQIKPIDSEEKYPLLGEKLGWYKIAYEQDKEGWVSADPAYTTKITE